MKRALFLLAVLLGLGATLRAGDIAVTVPESGSGAVPVVQTAPGTGASTVSKGSFADQKFSTRATFKAQARLESLRDQLAAGDASFDNGIAPKDAESSSLSDKLRDAWSRIRGKKGPTPSSKQDDGIAPEITGERVWVTVKAGSNRERTRASELGVDIQEVYSDSIAGVAHRSSVRRLNAEKLTVLKVESLERFALEAFPPEDNPYHDYAGVGSALDALVANSNGAATKFSIGKSLRGRDIWCVRFNTSKGEEADKKPGIVFMGNHHAREHLSVEVPLMLAQYLAGNADEATKKLLESRDIYIIPMVNPDGAEYDIYNEEFKGTPKPGKSGYRMWRKNLAKNSDGSYGVDLNRNYGYGWNTGGASDDPQDETYHGPSAFSEPETRAIRDFVESHKNLKVLLSFHTFSELILYPWGGKYEPITDQNDRRTYEIMAQTMAKWNGYKPEQSSELYIASGDTTDWAWGEHKIFSFTFELTPSSMWSGGFYPGAGVINSTFQANLKPALYLIDLADNPYKVLPKEGAGSSK